MGVRDVTSGQGVGGWWWQGTISYTSYFPNPAILISTLVYTDILESLVTDNDNSKKTKLHKFVYASF